MKANIERGKLIEPKSLTAGMQRQKQLIFETKRIEDQVNDPYRKDSFASPAEYDTWRASATRALKLFATELRLLTEWIEIRQNNAERLLREAYEALKNLREEVDFFEMHEAALMEKLDQYFDAKETSLVATGHPNGAANTRLTS